MARAGGRSRRRSLANGRFSIERRVRRPTVFVAQWAGDPVSDGDGTRPLIVRAGG